MDFRFMTEYPDARLDEIVSYLLGPRLWIPSIDYPDFDDWLGRTHDELRKETKRALIAVEQHSLIGVIIYQQHKTVKEALEIKNLTVRPDKRGRYIASFLMRNAEIEGGNEFNSAFALCDAKAHNIPIQHFLARHHYTVESKTDLYQHGTGNDVVFRKRLTQFRE